MKKLLLIGLFVSNIFANETITLSGDMNYPPYSYKENGIAKGVYVDIIKSAFSKMPKYSVQFNMMAWKRAIALTKKGKIVGFFPPYYSKERTAWTKFSEPILEETSVIFAKDKTLKGKKDFPKDFYGTTLCINRGFTTTTQGGTELTKAVENKKIKLIEANNNNDCLSRVKRDIADFYINDQLIDISKFKSIKRGMKTNVNLGHIGFTLKESRYPFMKDLQEKFNTTIKQMKLSGEIDTILQSYK